MRYILALDSQFAGKWTIDPDHSRIGFSARHAMVTKVRGAFNDVQGTAFIDPENWEKSYANVSVRVDSIDTRNAQRDEHLRNNDFFDVARYPTIEFVSASIDEVDDNQFIAMGELSMHGVTKPVSIPLDLTGINQDSFGIIRAGLEGGRRIDRKDWGITWNAALDAGGVMVSEKISLEFELSLVKETEDSSADTAA